MAVYSSFLLRLISPTAPLLLLAACKSPSLSPMGESHVQDYAAPWTGAYVAAVEGGGSQADKVFAKGLAQGLLPTRLPCPVFIIMFGHL